MVCVETWEITQDLRRRLASNEWLVGERIATFRELRAEYHIGSIGRLEHVLAPLKAEGLVEGQQGRGTVVLRLPEPESELITHPADVKAAMSLVAEAYEDLGRARQRLNRAHLLVTGRAT